jgi:hypothetical protein
MPLYPVPPSYFFLQPTSYPWLSLRRQVPSNASHPLGKHVIKSLKGPFISFFFSLRSAVADRDAHPVRPPLDCRGLHKAHLRQSLGRMELYMRYNEETTCLLSTLASCLLSTPTHVTT